MVRSRFRLRYLGFWSIVVVLGALAAVPLGLVLLNSFRNVGVGELGFSFSNMTLLNFTEAYSNPRTYTMLLNSLWFAFGSMIVAMVFGGVLAFLSERTDLRFREVIPVIVMVPLIMPSIVMSVAWVFLLTPDIGLLNAGWKSLGFSSSLFDAYSIPTMVWVEGISMSTPAFLLIGATIRRMDPSLEEVALGCGASMWKTHLRVTLPLAIPGLAGVMLILFIRGIEAFEVPLALGMAKGIYVFSTNIYYTLQNTFPPEYGLGFAYSMTLMVLTAVALLVYQRQMSHAERYVVVTGKGYRPNRIHLKGGRYLGWAFVAFYGIVAILLPIIIMVWGSLLPFYKQPSTEALSLVSLRNYKTIMTSPIFLNALKNTVILASVSSMAIMFLAAVCSWFIYRTNIAARRLLDFIIFMPYASSGIVVGVGFLILFSSFPNPIYGTIWIIVLAHVSHYMPQGSRFTHAALLQIHNNMEEAAWACGANFWQTLQHIWLPLMLPALINGALYVAVLSFKVMSIAALLQSPGNMVLPVYLWSIWERMGLGSAAALAVVMIVILGTLTFFSRRLGAMIPGQEI